MWKLRIMQLACAMLCIVLVTAATGCGGGAGGSFGGNNVSKKYEIDLSGVSFSGPQAELPVDLDGDGHVDGVIKGGVIIYIADVITQTDSGLLAGATLTPKQAAAGKSKETAPQGQVITVQQPDKPRTGVDDPYDSDVQDRPYGQE